jgi:erythromycin esterase-like protein
MANHESLSAAITRAAHRLTGSAQDYDPLFRLPRLDDIQIVLLGEATHGTHEFYRARAEITQRLIKERGFNAIALEADWPDSYQVNRYITGMGKDTNANQALSGFKRFPTWMWRNREVLELVEWLHAYNQDRSYDKQVGFYGLDLYSLHASMAAVIRYLDKVDPVAAQRARHRYACFDQFGIDPHMYAYATAFGGMEACEEEVIEQLLELRQNATRYLQRDGLLASDEYFFAEQNAKLVKNVEEYYRSMLHARRSSWNLRDRHMAETLNALVNHLNESNRPTKVVVWAHNSHVGDARATEMGKHGELNLGQLVREHYGEYALNLGFTTYTGTVTAAWGWDKPGQRRRVCEALKGSYERLLHDTGLSACLLIFAEHPYLDELRLSRLERAIGVVYRPDTERNSHYFEASLSNQFDAVIHFDQTRAVEPLDLDEHWQVDEAPETYPFGI